jgi:hypothetical protein
MRLSYEKMEESIGVVIMIQTLPMPLLHKIAGLELSDVRITLAGTI